MIDAQFDKTTSRWIASSVARPEHPEPPRDDQIKNTDELFDLIRRVTESPGTGALAINPPFR